MKQNEKFLVYAVTGFLVVILAVAILFGEETPRRVPDEVRLPTIAQAPPSLEEVLNRRVGNGAEPAKENPAAPAADTSVAPPSDGDRALAAADGQRSAAPGVQPAVFGTGSDMPLAANVQLLPRTPAALITEKLGLNRREHDYRIVRARAGDSLSSLVQKWCGSTGDYLEQARALNEELTMLRLGQEVVLPWVDDEVLLAAIESRGTAAPAAAPTVGSAGPVDTGAGPLLATTGLEGILQPTRAREPQSQPQPLPVAEATRRYRIQSGDSLWKIAEREVGRKQVKQFLDRIRELNPGLDTDRIRVGQEIVLPAKG